MPKFFFRLLASVVMLISVLFMPWWITVILALICMAYFDHFFEAIGLLFLSDILFGIPESKFFGLIFVSTISGIIALVFVELMKKKLKFYN